MDAALPHTLPNAFYPGEMDNTPAAPPPSLCSVQYLGTYTGTSRFCNQKFCATVQGVHPCNVI